MLNFLYLVTRMDEYKDHCWGDNLDMVICSNSDENTEKLIKDNLLTNSIGRPASKANGKPLTREEIQVVLIGKATVNSSVGVVLMTNAGA